MSLKNRIRFLLLAGLSCSLLLGYPVLGWADQIKHTYDASNRLIRTEYGNGGAIEYSYDAAGNIISKQLSLTPAACTGDCNTDGGVIVNELLTMVNIALGNQPVGACGAGDENSDGEITIDEILAAVNNALNGCWK